MAIRRRKAYTRKRRGARRARGMRTYNKRNQSKAVITRVKGIGFSDSMYVKLTYVERFDLNTAAALQQVIMRGNSAYDPNQTGSGHQPLFFDQYAGVYNRYRVHASSIKIDVINHSAVAGLYYTVTPATDPNTFTSISEIYEQNRSSAPKYVPIAARIASRIKRYSTTRKVCGLTKTQIYDDTFAAAVTTDPGNVWFWNIFFESDDLITPIDGYMTLKMVYYVSFFDRRMVAQS